MNNIDKTSSTQKHETKMFVPQEIERNNPIDLIQNSINKNIKLTLLIDGYNVIRSYHYRSTFYFTDEVEALIEKRKRLILIVENLLRKSPNMKAVLYFDSPFHSDISVSLNFRVIFSGGGIAEQKADMTILSYLQYRLTLDSLGKTIVITDDKKLSEEASKRNSFVMSVQEFSKIL